MQIPEPNPNHNRHSGFTLVETILYIAILSVVAVAFSMYVVSISNARSKTKVVKEVQSNARLALSLITQKIRAAESINTAQSTFNTDPGVLSLNMADPGLNPTVIQLNQDNGQLIITEGTSVAIPVTSDQTLITDLRFTDLTPTSGRDSILINFTIDYDNYEDVYYQYTKQLETAVTLRK